MAISTNPLMQGMSGRVGNLIFRNLNGKTYMCLYNPKRKKSSPVMKMHQEKFKMVMQHLNPIRSFINQVNPTLKSQSWL